MGVFHDVRYLIDLIMYAWEKSSGSPLFIYDPSKDSNL
jgi:hypothetical protein